MEQFGAGFVVDLRVSLLALSMSARIIFADSHPGGDEGVERVRSTVEITRSFLDKVWGDLQDCNTNRPVWHAGYHYSVTHDKFGSCANVAVHRFEAKHAAFRKVTSTSSLLV